MLHRIVFLLIVITIINIVNGNIKHSTNKQLTVTSSPSNTIIENNINQTVHPSDSIISSSLDESNNNVSISNFKFNAYKEVICTDIDVRNYVSNFEILRNCTVVEGYVQINLIDNSTINDFANLSFPELREITEYLLFYHVSGLRSIGSLFPNLSIIRGNTFSVWEYTFSIFSMNNLIEINLPRLTHITKGTVVIIRNPLLCYVKTIDWEKIAKKGNIFITDNKALDSCAVEHNSQKTKDNCDHYLSPKICQMNLEKLKCHHLCSGGCNGPTANDCFVCLGVVHKGQCLDKCPEDMYIYMNRRCLTKEECLNNKRDTNKNFPAGMKKSFLDQINWKPFQGSCTQECPPGYNRTADDTSCELCKDQSCPKTCEGISIKYIHQARDLKGCTKIAGSIEVQIRQGDSEIIYQELEQGLGMIKEITGHLKLSHSLPIQSLGFLRSLRIIHGKSLIENNESPVQNNYTLIVWDNPNLQELWDWNLINDTEPKFQIKSGKILFHDNPKLCIDKIFELVHITNVEYDEFDILRESNGDEFTCGASLLKVDILSKTDNSLYFKLIEKERPKNSDNNKRYVLFYIKSDNEEYNINYETVGNCEASSWKFKDISSKDKTVNLTNLEPHTKYALFVKVYHTKQIQRSNITFEFTLPARPSIPPQFKLVATNSTSVSLSWKSPKHPHGILNKYIIKVFHQNDDVNFIDLRNYCDEKAVYYQETSDSQSQLIKYSARKSSPLEKKKDCCEKEHSCELEHESLTYVNSQKHLIHECDNYLSTFLQHNQIHDFSRKTPVSIVKKPDLVFEVNISDTTFIATGLLHFQKSVFKLSACREEVTDQSEFLRSDPEIGRCSVESWVIARTDKVLSADAIDSNSMEFTQINNSWSKLSWKPPPNPNGIIITYSISYKRSESESSEHCITRKDFDKTQGILLSTLQIGYYYQFKVQANSLAGEGPWTNWRTWKVEDKNPINVVYHILIIGGLTIAVCMLGTILYLMYVQKKNLEKRKKDTLIASVNPEYVKVPYVVDEWEVNRDDVEILNLLGRGTFGIVHEGRIKSKGIKVAVKTITDNATDRDRMAFLKEATTMKSFAQAHNIVGLIGVVSTGHPPLILIELMALGDLKTFLRNTRESKDSPPPPSVIMIKMAAQIADGMEYMEAKKFVHRDLAARNCMVAQDLSVKIGDMGMSRDIYQTDYYRKGDKGLMPIRWMAPESLNDGIFTSLSDIWSYGIVLWEMANLAEQPYQGLSNDEVLKFVISGNTLSHLSMPVYCPDVLRTIMVRCWAWKPSRRPTFSEIINCYEDYLDDKFRSTSYHHSGEAKPKASHEAPSTSRSLAENSNDTTDDVVETTSLLDQVVSFHKSNNTDSGEPNGEINED